MKAPASSPLPLALLRVVLPLVIVLSPELYVAPALAALPQRLDVMPEGLHLFAGFAISPSVARLLQVVALSSAATASLGWRSRSSMLVLTLSAGALFSLSQRSGAVLHDMHLFWLGFVLAASRCGDAWSLDAWGRPRPAPSPRYGVPVALCRGLLGLVYFFPGLHKLRVSGASWLHGDNVVNHMRAKWLEHAEVPFLRVDHFPVLCAVGAAFVVTFELSFVALVLTSRTTRAIGIVLGLLFHAATQLFFFIRFSSLWASYVVLLDDAWLQRAERRLRALLGESSRVEPPRAGGDPTSAGAPSRLPLGATVVGAILVTAVVVQGLRGATQAWPFACYPTFAHLQEPTLPDLAVEIVRTDGTRVVLTGRESHVRTQADWGRVFRISGAYGDVPDPAALRGHAREVIVGARIDPASVARVRVSRVYVATAPEQWATTPPEGVLLTELSLPL